MRHFADSAGRGAACGVQAAGALQHHSHRKGVRPLGAQTTQGRFGRAGGTARCPRRPSETGVAAGLFTPGNYTGQEESKEPTRQSIDLHGAPGWDRTSNPCLRRAVLYPLSYGRTNSLPTASCILAAPLCQALGTKQSGCSVSAVALHPKQPSQVRMVQAPQGFIIL